MNKCFSFLNHHEIEKYWQSYYSYFEKKQLPSYIRYLAVARTGKSAYLCKRVRVNYFQNRVRDQKISGIFGNFWNFWNFWDFLWLFGIFRIFWDFRNLRFLGFFGNFEIFWNFLEDCTGFFRVWFSPCKKAPYALHDKCALVLAFRWKPY